MALREISKTEFEMAKTWVRDAKNFTKGGYVSHSMNCEEAYYLNRSGKEIMALYCVDDDEDSFGMHYYMDVDVYDIFKNKFGYSI